MVFKSYFQSLYSWFEKIAEVAMTSRTSLGKDKVTLSGIATVLSACILLLLIIVLLILHSFRNSVKGYHAWSTTFISLTAVFGVLTIVGFIWHVMEKKKESKEKAAAHGKGTRSSKTGNSP